MTRYLTLVNTRMEKLDKWSIKRVPQEEKGQVDALVGVATTLPIQETMMLTVYFQATHFISLERVHDIDYANLGWIEEIAKYLPTREVLEDEKQAHKIRVQAIWYILING